MNYTLELNTQSKESKVVFNNIIFDSFKINIIDRYRGNMTNNPVLWRTIFKVRTIDNNLIETIGGNNRVILKGIDFKNYNELVKILNSYQYKNKLIKRKDADEDYVHFMLSLFLANYKID